MESATDQRSGGDELEGGLLDLTGFSLADVLLPGDDTVIGRALHRRIDELTRDQESLAAFDSFAPDDDGRRR